MRKAETRIRAFVVVSLRVLVELRLRCDFVGDVDSAVGVRVLYIHFAAQRASLRLQRLDCLSYRLPPLLALRVWLSQRSKGGAAGFGRWVEDAERGPEGEVVADSGVRLAGEELGDGEALGVVAGEEGPRSGTTEDEGEFPGEVVGVLEAGVCSETFAGRVPVNGVAEAEAGLLSDGMLMA